MFYFTARSMAQELTMKLLRDSIFLYFSPRLVLARIMERPETFPTTNKLAQIEMATATKKHHSNKIFQQQNFLGVK